MSQEKRDFPPLLGAGLHAMTIADLGELTRSAFPQSKNRPLLFTFLEIYLGHLSRLGLVADVWIDGSFMCQKQEPEDVDIVVLWDAASVRDLDDEEWMKIDLMLRHEYAVQMFRIDVHPIDRSNQEDAAFWMQKFGTQRDNITPKGLALLRLNQ